ncbi:MAG: deoxyribose-phosphate aldolase [Thomasclavelia sp.]|nr:deoxyribose-phosphate aldolase [Thomasclavelia sp.]
MKKYNKLIDHTLLKPNALDKDIIKLCKEAKENDFMSVCVNPAFIKLCVNELKDSDIKVCTVIGFPLGTNMTSTKVFETSKAIENGADEIDMVINISALKDKKYDYLLNEIKEVKQATNKHTLKVIIETCLLTKEEIVKICQIAKEAGADFVKTSTGFSTGGAQKEDVKLMKDTVGNMGVKASGGISTYQDVKDMVDAGASRIGTSHGLDIIKGSND